jgi:hypothetical protein
MCWSAKVSFIFSVVYACTILWVLYRRNGKWKAHIAFLAIFMIMELFQGLQWLYGDVSSVFPDTTTCTLNNRYFTYFAYFLIIVQPLWFAIIGGYDNQWEGGWKRLILVNLAVFLFNMIYQIVITEKGTFYGYLLNQDNIYSFVTCTFIGPNGHLAWVFAGGSNTIFYTWQMYLVLSCIAFIQYKGDIIGMPVAWVVTLIISLVVTPFTYVEIASYWCFLSVISCVFILFQEIKFI